MDRNPFAPDFKDLPQTLPVFPLHGVLLLPHGNLPLNVFEPHYVCMVEDALRGNRMIGMVQPREEKSHALYDIGCAGKITDFTETPDGRYLITLTGLCRFRIAEESSSPAPYRTVRPDWVPYEKDLHPTGCLGLDRTRLHALLKSYLPAQNFDCDWSKIEEAPDGKLITCLSMICPLDAKEKQALLEAACGQTRARDFMTMLEMAVAEGAVIGACGSRH